MAICTGDAPASVERCRRETGIAYPILLDGGEVAKAFDIASSPTCVLVDPGGSIRYRSARPPEHLR